MNGQRGWRVQVLGMGNGAGNSLPLGHVANFFGLD
jgi:hypothetical protein